MSLATAKIKQNDVQFVTHEELYPFKKDLVPLYTERSCSH